MIASISAVLYTTPRKKKILSYTVITTVAQQKKTIVYTHTCTRSTRRVIYKSAGDALALWHTQMRKYEKPRVACTARNSTITLRRHQFRTIRRFFFFYFSLRESCTTLYIYIPLPHSVFFIPSMKRRARTRERNYEIIYVRIRENFPRQLPSHAGSPLCCCISSYCCCTQRETNDIAATRGVLFGKNDY